MEHDFQTFLRPPKWVLQRRETGLHRRIKSEDGRLCCFEFPHAPTPQAALIAFRALRDVVGHLNPPTIVGSFCQFDVATLAWLRLAKPPSLPSVIWLRSANSGVRPFLAFGSVLPNPNGLFFRLAPFCQHLPGIFQTTRSSATCAVRMPTPVILIFINSRIARFCRDHARRSYRPSRMRSRIAASRASYSSRSCSLTRFSAN